MRISGKVETYRVSESLRGLVVGPKGPGDRKELDTHRKRTGFVRKPLSDSACSPAQKMLCRLCPGHEVSAMDWTSIPGGFLVVVIRGPPYRLAGAKTSNEASGGQASPGRLQAVIFQIVVGASRWRLLVLGLETHSANAPDLHHKAPLHSNRPARPQEARLRRQDEWKTFKTSREPVPSGWWHRRQNCVPGVGSKQSFANVVVSGPLAVARADTSTGG
ncbi:hypothetical protein FB451DRAFT_1252601 [Mycena latifolia]|nr:hypothetical protein FB451DRAFT_1252601 [Mycena latifolia]